MAVCMCFSNPAYYGKFILFPYQEEDKNAPALLLASDMFWAQLKP